MAVHNHQLSLALIPHRVGNDTIDQRAGDGYINATALCKVAGKRWYNYLRNETTGHFLRALEAKTQIRALDLIQEVTTAGVTATWVHPKVAIHLAQWLSAEFAVQVSEWVYDWMNGKGTPAPKSLPYHIERHMLNAAKIPAGYFSVLQEMTMILVAPMDHHGYELPEGMMPDISMAKMLCATLREQFGVDTKALPVYMHTFPDGRSVQANLYPDTYLAEFRKLMQQEWLPQRSSKYFGDRDPKALPVLDKVIMALPGPKSAANDRQALPVRRKKRKQ
jgi:hypothetical protein